MGIIKQSKEKSGKENLWFFSEEIVGSFSPSVEQEDSGNPEKYSRIIKEKNGHLVPKAIEKDRFKRECSFVVEWQLEDSF